jgi:hypothetical protein
MFSEVFACKAWPAFALAKGSPPVLFVFVNQELGPVLIAPHLTFLLASVHIERW